MLTRRSVRETGKEVTSQMWLSLPMDWSRAQAHAFLSCEREMLAVWTCHGIWWGKESNVRVQLDSTHILLVCILCFWRFLCLSFGLEALGIFLI